jgi:hypothetical protein
MRRSLMIVASIAGMTFAASNANALTATNVDNVTAAWSHVDLTNTLDLSGGAWVGTSPSMQMGSSVNDYRSPFDGSDSGGVTPTDWQDIPYWSVGPTPNATQTADLKFGGDRTFFSLLWGSIDDYNLLEFFRGGSSVGSVPYTDLVGPGTPRLGASFVTVTDLVFDEVKFSSNTNAFEFANVVATPLPASLLLFLSGVGGLGFLSRRRTTTRRNRAIARAQMEAIAA